MNAAPHIGHTYTTMAADTIERFKRMQGYDAVMFTGTDEHGQNVERAAEAPASRRKNSPTSSPPSSARQWEMLGHPRGPLHAHHRARSITNVVQWLFQRCRDNGYIYKGTYTGQYCIYDELYVNDAKPGDPCPDCGRPTETVTEENYFFKLSAFADKLLDLYESQPGLHPAGIAPQRSDLFRARRA